MPLLGHDTILGAKQLPTSFTIQSVNPINVFLLFSRPWNYCRNHHSSNCNSWSRSFLLKSAILLKHMRGSISLIKLFPHYKAAALLFELVHRLCSVCGSGSRRVVRKAPLLLLLVEEQQGLATCNNLHLLLSSLSLSVQSLSSSLFFPW